MPAPLFADMAAWPIYIAFGGMVAAGVFGAVGVAWLGYWLVRRSQRKAEAVSENSP